MLRARVCDNSTKLNCWVKEQQENFDAKTCVFLFVGILWLVNDAVCQSKGVGAEKPTYI